MNCFKLQAHMFLVLLFCTALFSRCTAAAAVQQEQVHISLGTDEREMVVTWATVHPLPDQPVVHFADTEESVKTLFLTKIVSAETSHFTGDGNASLFTHRAVMYSLSAGTKFYYRVGSPRSSWSPVFSFRTLRSGANWLPRFALFGDLGYQNEVSLPYLSKEVQQEDRYDVIFHIGDMAYDLQERNGEQGNDFMRSIERVAARVPYMTCPGNHERYDNFSHYDARFSMIADRARPHHGAALSSRLNNHFHSMDIGPAHIVMFSTEFYYFTEFGWEQIRRQYEWLEADLKRANANRAQRKWIIVLGHRPLYCLKVGDNASCEHATFERPKIRQGLHMLNESSSSPLKYGLEELFHRYGVDLYIAGHEHFYARMLPLYNFTVMGGASSSTPYTNPRAPVHITTGSAGNRENHPLFDPNLKSFVALAEHHYDYGFTRLSFKDGGDRILLEQTSDDKNGTVVDHVDIIKTTVLPHWLL